ncbi:MAG: hypothetical protein HN352_13605 [Bacteroidetes bacterium]|jgi:hypothetical protein|nr:hypothetical protein [Bacteroidota bacterium]MBT3751116.1 hypothetical protein [Bacteroidota bacterium]MBT4400474.1 hypothetical protein [Bacteroidota bacterium]MBT4409668.1 hypothetical protein [Bacteroidota bacterium]MBT5426405.1 hypothetical protein [Bacteroidota bacterium]
MEAIPADYRISFFKPTTDSARRNRNMIIQLVIVWVVASKNTLVHVVSGIFVRISKQLKYYTIINP